MKKSLIIVIAILVIINFQTQNLNAAWGDFDPNFGFLGAQTEQMTDHYPQKVAFQTDGKILVMGYRLLSTGKKRLFLRRYLPSGQPDSSFGSDGSAIIYTLVNKIDDDTGSDIAVMPNGQIAVAGSNKDNLPTIWKFNSDGRLDGTFGNGGIKTISNPNYSGSGKIAAQNTKLVVGVSKNIPNSNSRVAVIRLNNDGTQDSRFGSSGETVTRVFSALGFSLLVENETGKITIGGHSADNTSAIGLERLMSAGQIDSGFVFANVPVQGYGYN